MSLSDADVEKMSSHLEAAGWRRRDINGVVVWTLRGFDGLFSLVEAFGYVCAGWSAQRLADLVKPWYKDRAVWFTVLSAFGGVGTAIITELVGSQNHILSSLGLALGTLAPFIARYLHAQAQQAAVLDMRKSDEFWAAQPPPSLPPRPQEFGGTITLPDGTVQKLPKDKP